MAFGWVAAADAEAVVRACGASLYHCATIEVLKPLSPQADRMMGNPEVSMIKQSEFFTEYRINKKKFETCGLEWDELTKIATAYVRCRLDLEPTAKYIADCPLCHNV